MLKIDVKFRIVINMCVEAQPQQKGKHKKMTLFFCFPLHSNAYDGWV